MNFKRVAAAVLAGAMTASLLTGCGLNKDAIVTKFNNEPVRLGLVNFMARYEQAAMDDLYKAYFGENVWEQDLYGNGNNMTVETVNSIMETIHGLLTLEAHAEEFGISVTDEELAKIKETTDTFLKSNSKAALKEMGATEEIVTEMLRLFTIKSKMHAAVIEQAAVAVTDEEANMRGYTGLNISLTSHYDSEAGEYVPYTEEEVAERKALAQQISEEIADGMSLEDAAEAHELTAEYKTYAADNDTLDETLKLMLDTLQEGEITSVTTEGMIYIVRLDQENDAEATEEHRKSLLSSREEEAFTAQLETWQEGDGFDANINQEQLDKIVFRNYFTQSADEEGSEVGTEAE